MDLNQGSTLKFLTTLGGLLLFLMVFNGPSMAQRISWSGNMQYSTGTYFFTEPVNSFYFVNGITISSGRLTASAGMPFIVQNTPWVSYTSSGLMPTGGPQHGSVQQGRGGGGQMGGGRRYIVIPDTGAYSQTGFGDPWVHLSVSLLKPGGSTSLRLTSGFKIPMADPVRGFGTGAWDAGAGLSLAQRIQKTILFADASYWWLGDMNDLELKNSLSYGVGAGRMFYPSKWMITGSLQGSTAIIDNFDPPVSVNAALGYLFSGSASVNGVISAGLSESAPDFTLGFGWDIKL